MKKRQMSSIKIKKNSVNETGTNAEKNDKTNTKNHSRYGDAQKKPSDFSNEAMQPASSKNHPVFLPTNRKEMQDRGWDEIDFLFISGDAYVDHPSFGHAMISRLLEARGYKVGILAQPDWRGTEEARRRILERMGTPRLGVMITSGVLDSMVNNYTAAGRKRKGDSYSPGGKSGKRPDRALDVYVSMVRECFGDNIPVIVGGLEPSLRRFTHYDYWADAVCLPILANCSADIMVYGTGERAVTEVAALLDKGVPVKNINSLRNTAIVCHLEDLPLKLQEDVALLASSKTAARLQTSEHRLPNQNQEYDRVQSTQCTEAAGDDIETEAAIVRNKAHIREKISNTSVVLLPTHEEAAKDKKLFAKAFMLAYQEQDGVRGKTVLQQLPDGRYVVQFPPQLPLSEAEMDELYAFPYTRTWHPSYDKDGGVPALEEVSFSVTSHRGCFGGCTFCAIGFHQGRTIQARSVGAVLQEVEMLTTLPDFKGYIHDIGGPTANFRKPSCKLQATQGVCAHRECLYPTPCKHLDLSHEEYLEILRKARKITGVKKVFVRSGVRYDFAMMDPSGEFMPELIQHHVSGQLKVAPEHVSSQVLACMGKPRQEVYDGFVKKFHHLNQSMGMKQYLVPYFISGHPGSTLKDAVELAVYIRKTGTVPEQVQQFIPVPGTLAGAMYWSGYDPRSMKTVYVPRREREQAMQRALLQCSDPKNRPLVLAALRETGRTDLIGFGPNFLISPR